MQVKYRTPEEVMELWIEALRSGEYKQTKEKLKSKSGGFCCLGVLCDLAAKDGGPQWEKDRYGVWKYKGEYIGDPPDYITDYIGITYNERSRLILMNDDENKSFKKIADYIERELLPKVPND